MLDPETPVSSKFKSSDNLVQTLLDRIEEMENTLSGKINIVSLQLQAITQWQTETNKRINALEGKVASFDTRILSVELNVENLKTKKPAVDINEIVLKTKDLIETQPNNPNELLKTIRDECHELQRRNDKKCNIIVYGMTEVSSFAEDLAQVKKLLTECRPNSQITPKQLIRLGEPRRRDERPRPLLLEFYSLHDKLNIMTAKHHISNKNQFKHVSLTHDFTIKQREERKKYAAEHYGSRHRQSQSNSQSQL